MSLERIADRWAIIAIVVAVWAMVVAVRGVRMSGKKSIDEVLRYVLDDMEKAYAYNGEFSHDKWEIEEVRDALERLEFARKMHAKRTVGGVPSWPDIDSLLELLCGPMDRRKRCATCGGDGRVLLGTEKTMACPSCEDGYTKGVNDAT